MDTFYFENIRYMNKLPSEVKKLMTSEKQEIHIQRRGRKTKGSKETIDPKCLKHQQNKCQGLKPTLGQCLKTGRKKT